MQDELLTPWNAEQWLWLFHQPYCDYHMLRKQVYAYTVQAAMKGSYDILQTDPKTGKTQTKTVTLLLDPDIAKHTKMYRSKQNPPVRNRYEKTEFKVLAQDCLAVAKTFVEQNDGKVAVLNMANRKNPGGGVYGGAGVLYISLWITELNTGWNVPTKAIPWTGTTAASIPPMLLCSAARKKKGIRSLKNHGRLTLLLLPAFTTRTRKRRRMAGNG